MNIVFVYKSSQVHTGSGYILQNLMEHLNEQDGINVISLTESPELDPEKYPSLVNAKTIVKKPKLPQRAKRFALWSYWFHMGTIIRNGVKFARDHKADAIVAVFPDEYFMWAGYRIACKLNIPLYPWFHNTYVENRSFLGVSLGKRLQAKIFEHSPKVLTMSDGLRDYYRQAYPEFSDKFETLQHGFKDISSDAVSKPSELSGKSNRTVKFVYTGNLSLSYLEATERFFRVIGANSDYELHVFSNSPESRFRAFTIPEANIVYHGFVGDDDLRSKMISECDVCLIPLGLTGPISPVEYQTIFPTRLISLLKSGLPLLVHAPDDSFLAQFIRRNDCGMVVSSNKDHDMADAIKELIADQHRAAAYVQNAEKTFGYFKVDHTAQILLDTINNTN